MNFYRGDVIALAFVIISLTNASGREPSDAYKLQFENEWVRITRVHYEPREKLAAHAHTLSASAYVYLNDGGPVVFNHIDKDYGAVTRPPTKAGAFRLYRAVRELHEVDNQSDLPSDFLRVEFKTDPINEHSLTGRYYRLDVPAGENLEKVQFENEQVRITRLICAPGKTLSITTPSTEPSMLIALSAARFRIGSNQPETLSLDIGESHWLGPNQTRVFKNAQTGPAEMLRFDFKTKPLTREELEKGSKHEHPSSK